MPIRIHLYPVETEGNAAINPAPVLNGSFVHSLTDKLKFGFAVGSIAGAGLDYGTSWAGRQQATKVKLLTMTAIPSVAYKQHWLSVGVGLTINYGNLDTFNLKAPNPAESTDRRPMGMIGPLVS